MSTRFFWPCTAFAAFYLMAGPLAAQDTTQKPTKPWYKAVSFNAFVSASHSYNFNRPATHLNALRVFDFRDNRPRVDVAELVVQKPVSQPGDWGFRTDITAGQSVPKIAASNGLFRNDETGEAEDFDIHQLFVSYIASEGAAVHSPGREAGVGETKFMSAEGAAQISQDYTGCIGSSGLPFDCALEELHDPR